MENNKKMDLQNADDIWEESCADDAFRHRQKCAIEKNMQRLWEQWEKIIGILEKYSLKPPAGCF